MNLKKKTVFVLGAGASAPYGYPIGSVLREEIIGLGGDINLHAAYQAAKDFVNFNLGIDPDLAPAYSEQYSKTNPFFNLSDAFARSGQLSIDEFLRTNKVLIEIGKFSIAHVLLKNEEVGSLVKTGWLQLLWSRLARGKMSLDEIASDIAFVTFNYDTSLEYILSEAIKHTFPGTNDYHVLEFFKKNPIFHIHGKIKTLPWEGESNLYKIGLSQFNNSEIVKMSRGINLFHESGESDVVNVVKDLITGADKLVFLGFGFDAINVDKLNLISPKWVPDVPTRKSMFMARNNNIPQRETGQMRNLSSFRGKKIFSTGIGLSEQRKKDIKKIEGLQGLAFVDYRSIYEFLDAHLDEFL